MTEYDKQESPSALLALLESASTAARSLWDGDPLPVEIHANAYQTQLAHLAARLIAAGQDTLGPDASGQLQPLVPILSQVTLTEPLPKEDWRLAPDVLNLETLVPRQNVTTTQEKYAELWQELCTKVSDTGLAVSAAYSTTWLALLRKYLSLLPSAIGTDVSLYEQVRLTAALAVCLEQGLSATEQQAILTTETIDPEQPVALMVRGDLSGIQSFIYRVTRPAADASFTGVAKRLRGRSFYLALLGDVFTDWLIRELSLTPANILFCGGGRFDLLIPHDSQSLHKLNTCLETIEDWLLETFYGELGIQFVTHLLCPADFADIRAVYTDLEYDLGRKKSRKWQYQVQQAAFHLPAGQDYYACANCNLSPVSESGDICALCDKQHKIGGKLPTADWLAFVYGAATPPEGAIEVSFDAFGTRVWLMGKDKDKDEAQKSLATWPRENVKAVFYRLNDTDFLPEVRPAGVNFSFHFLANTAPVALRDIPRPGGQDPTKEGDVLDFDQIADLSTGAIRLGVLKADVDHLGLIFGEGLKPLTLARQATLSTAMEGFFSGRLNKICQQVHQDWLNELGAEHLHRDDADNIFYTLYAGGDDLFIIGPWDQTVELAKHLQSEFSAYVCHNANVTLSAGVVQVKPHYPAQRFAQLVSERLEAAKNAGRKRINVFAHTMEWQPDRKPSFDAVLSFANELTDHVIAEQLPHSFIYCLGRLYREHYLEDDVLLEKPNPMYLPKLHYYLIRRWAGKEIDGALAIITKLWQEKMMAHAPILVSYTSLITRKEQTHDDFNT